MKTFRFFATLLVIALCAGFTSCSSDDDDENESNSPLVGTWIMTKSIKDGHIRIPGQNGFDDGLGLVFSANGTFYNLVENEKAEDGKYSYDEEGNTLTLIYTDDETLFCSVKSFSESALVISYTEGSSAREDYFVKQ
ncbi:lipocalin family protein [Bacteroides thetaiotaomicron]|uniref:lipocalin family protein n=1 Tax=Bacteroides thetaiotaomicron TaxID=818 RepID=UPI00232FC205|nr:lipocalin family protein [Bacteroides thetaiotaomicron]MDC2008630.1 lipocalin family protein [Bacteroides thetaiotaomicron]MDC2022943.1 lipocalin family protein [Bacteroides thetaiotaomicron]MDC2025339.1 lipocalin family protein [Bacteroides thetaiotaomicron]MDC2032050.1 lipocalin family protein [Bacteroides thetaiotaomicron]MDC2062917.1 lipocalin family protein [Bacteroides thetaiotaomicron]